MEGVQLLLPALFRYLSKKFSGEIADALGGGFRRGVEFRAFGDTQLGPGVVHYRTQLIEGKV